MNRLAGLPDLPTELVQDIALRLDKKSFANLRLVSRELAYKTNSESLYRIFFLREYDAIKLDRMKYPKRTWYSILRERMVSLASSNKPGPRRFNNPLDDATLKVTSKVLMDLLVESDPQVETSACKNYSKIKSHCLHSNFLCKHFEPASALAQQPQRQKRRRIAYSPETKRKYEVSRAVLAPLFITSPLLHACSHHNQHFNNHFHIDQAKAYASFVVEPILLPNLQVNVTWLNHVLNFFSFYAQGCEPLPGRFWDHWRSLNDLEKPQLSTIGYSSTGPSVLGRVWKGTYSYLERRDMDTLRMNSVSDSSSSSSGGGSSSLNRMHFKDCNIDNGHPIQTMKLYVPGSSPGLPKRHSYQDHFHQYLHTMRPFQDNTKDMQEARRATYGYEGIGYDDENFFATGHMTPLPAQSGMPGFQRMTMMKYFVDPRTGEIDAHALWCYEGVVLPGGQLIVGRWWAPEPVADAKQYSGPFILWCVDKSWPAEDIDNVTNHDSLRPVERPLTRLFPLATGSDDNDNEEDDEEDNEDYDGNDTDITEDGIDDDDDDDTIAEGLEGSMEVDKQEDMIQNS